MIKILLSLTILFLTFCTTNTLYGQQGEWTWMNGDSTSQSFPNYGTKGVSSPLSKPGARNSFASWTDNQGNFWMFGGFGRIRLGTVLNDLWKYDLSTNQWTWISGVSVVTDKSVYGTKGVSSPTNKPGARYSSISWSDNSGNLFLYGGTNNPYSLNDLWKFNTQTSEWTWIHGDTIPNKDPMYGTQGVSSPTNKPGGRSSSTTWTDSSSNAWLFGGSSWTKGSYNDLWKYNMATNEWTWVSGTYKTYDTGYFGIKGVASSLNHPSARFDAIGWTDKTGDFWLFGGRINNSSVPRNGWYNDLWKFNVSTGLWVWMHGDKAPNTRSSFGTQNQFSPNSKPGSRSGAAAFVDSSNSLWLFAGSKDLDYYNDLWKYNISSNEWAWVNGDTTRNKSGRYGTLGVPSYTNKPGARDNHTVWVDSQNNFWLYGGRLNGFGTYSDLWKYNMQAFILPVKLISFKGNISQGHVKLYWLVENEQNFSHYELERSFNKEKFDRIASLTASGLQQYNYEDKSIEINGKTVYYRLKLIDKDGKFSYSKIVFVRLPSSNSFLIFPNPARTEVQLQLEKNIRGKIEILVSDINGKIVMKRFIDFVQGNITLPINHLTSGKYLVKITSGNEKLMQPLVVVR